MTHQSSIDSLSMLEILYFIKGKQGTYCQWGSNFALSIWQAIRCQMKAIDLYVAWFCDTMKLCWDISKAIPNSSSADTITRSIVF